jgi:F0F1-type ATP synthase membrane subunit b/b'
MLTLPPDFTFLIQFGTFAVLVAVLGRLLFAPFLEVLAERDARTTGDVEKAAASRAEVQALSARVDAELAKARAEANAEVDAVKRRTREEASQLFQDAQRDATARLTELRAQVADATREARGALATDARTLADAMVTAVISGGGTSR